jgi:hypothetical protein
MDDTQECKHTVSQGRKGEKGSWCCSCGVKVLDVDERECGGCAHFRQLLGRGICKKHLMGCHSSMHVTYKIAEGSCWTPALQQQPS